jgi:hypothetical protein
VRPSVKSDKTEEAHETGRRDEHAEARDSGREGEEEIGSIDISCANLYIYVELKGQVDKEELVWTKVTHDEGMEVGPVVPQKEPGITYDPETRCYATSSN